MSLHQSIERRQKADSAVGKVAVPSETAVMLELVTWEGARWAFPWSHLASAKIAATDRHDELVLSFTTHNVMVEGENLGKLWGDVVGLRLGSLCEFPVSYRAKQGKETPFVTRIVVVAFDASNTIEGRGDNQQRLANNRKT